MRRSAGEARRGISGDRRDGRRPGHRHRRSTQHHHDSRRQSRAAVGRRPRPFDQRAHFFRYHPGIPCSARRVHCRNREDDRQAGPQGRREDPGADPKRHGGDDARDQEISRDYVPLLSHRKARPRDSGKWRAICLCTASPSRSASP